jgi:membrane-bound lytic murein transglycosylase D
MTRKGYAKVMWRFIPDTAVTYSLRIGPLVDQRRPDPGHDGHDYKKETRAAAQYIQDLYRTGRPGGFLLLRS